MTSSSTHTEPKGHLLIVDDELELRVLLQMKFQKSGFAVDLAANGEEAQKKLSEKNYSAVLCDLNLPNDPKGIALYELSNSKQNKPAFIVITGYTQDSPEVRAARLAGIKHIFSKPLNLRNILSLLG
ncbi:MAG: response regulator [Betaproteobacteria bacterium]|nr:response regulator [Betaproteobacteria bacterium]